MRLGGSFGTERAHRPGLPPAPLSCLRQAIQRAACFSVVQGSEVEMEQALPRLGSSDTDIARASELQHAVEDMHGHVDLRRPTFVPTRAQSVADHLFPAPDRRLHLARLV